MHADDEGLLEDLLLDWEERHERGDANASDELCARAGDLADELRRRIEGLRAFAEIIPPAADEDLAPEPVPP